MRRTVGDLVSAQAKSFAEDKCGPQKRKFQTVPAVSDLKSKGESSTNNETLERNDTTSDDYHYYIDRTNVHPETSPTLSAKKQAKLEAAQRAAEEEQRIAEAKAAELFYSVVLRWGKRQLRQRFCNF